MLEKSLDALNGLHTTYLNVSKRKVEIGHVKINRTVHFCSNKSYKMFGAKKLPVNWIEIKTLAELNEAQAKSFERPVVLFKHSVTCGISAFAKARISDLTVDDTFQFYYIDLLSYREISNEIARKLGVIHQSPQIIVVKQGKAVFTTSHHSINQKVIKENL